MPSIVALFRASQTLNSMTECLLLYLVTKTHCTTDEASSCIDVVLSRHVNHLSKNVICDWHTSNIHSVIDVENLTLWIRSILDLECVAVDNIRVWFVFVVEIVILKSHVNLLTWHTHNKLLCILIVVGDHWLTERTLLHTQRSTLPTKGLAPLAYTSWLRMFSNLSQRLPTMIVLFASTL